MRRTAPMKEAPLSDRLAVLPQYLLPKQALTSTAGRFARARAGRWTTAAIERFIARYQVNMAGRKIPTRRLTPRSMISSRALKPGAARWQMPTGSAPWMAPSVSLFLERDQVFQAKGHSYSTTALVGGDAARAAVFDDGYFATSLSPAITTASTCPVQAGSRTWCTHRAICSQSAPLRRGACLGCSRATDSVVCFFESDQGPFVVRSGAYGLLGWHRGDTLQGPRRFHTVMHAPIRLEAASAPPAQLSNRNGSAGRAFDVRRFHLVTRVGETQSGFVWNSGTRAGLSAVPLQVHHQAQRGSAAGSFALPTPHRTPQDE